MALGATWQLVTDLSIGFVTFIFAGLLSPPSTGLVGRVVR